MISQSRSVFLRCGVLKCLVEHQWNHHVYRTISVNRCNWAKRDDINLSSLFKPVSVKSSQDDINIGAELTGTIDKTELVKLLNKFTQKKEIRTLCNENGLDCEDLLHFNFTGFPLSYTNLLFQCTSNSRRSPTSVASAWRQRIFPWTCTSSSQT